MIKLRFDKVTFSYPSQVTFQDASCDIQEGCYGVIGPNGSGKTTFLKLIFGELKPDSGLILKDKTLHSAYMEQGVLLNPNLSAFEAVRQGVTRILEVGKQLALLEEKFADPNYCENKKRLANLIARSLRLKARS